MRRKPADRVLETALHWALSGGEDYELLLCVAPECAVTVTQQIRDETSTRATIIGRCVASPNAENRVILRDQNGEEMIAPGGWTHF